MKTQRAHSFFVNVGEQEIYMSKLPLQHHLTVASQTVTTTRMRTYDYYVLLHKEDEEIQRSQHDDQ